MVNYPEQPVVQVSQQQVGSPYQSPANSNNTNMVLLTNPEGDLNNMELSLTSMRINENGERVPVGPPHLNNLGVMSVRAMVQSISNPITHLSYNEEEDINKRMLDYNHTLIKALMVSGTRWEIPNLASRTMVLDICNNYPYYSLKRSLNGGERSIWTRIVQEFVSKWEGPAMQNNNILSSMAKMAHMK